MLTDFKSRFIEMFGNLDINDKQWKMSTIGESAKVPLHYGSTASAVDYDSETRYVRITDIGSDGKLNDDFKSPSTYDSSYLLNKGDILFARSGSVGVTYLFDEDYKSIFAGYLIRFIPDDEKLDPEFTYQFTRSSYCQGILVGSKRGGVQKNVNAKQLSAIPIPLPPMDLQKEFVDFVHQVDKSKVIKESVKSRFIELFGTLADPKYGLVKVADLVSKDIEKVYKKYDSEDIIDYIDISSINKESRSIMDTVEYAIKDAPSRAQQCVIKGDILLSNVRPNLKTLAIVNSKKNNLVCSSGFTVLRCTDSCPEYLTIAITDDYFTDKLVKKANGSNYPAVTSKDVYNSVVPSASIELQKQFAEFVQQIDKSKVGAPSTILLINIYINTEA